MSVADILQELARNAGRTPLARGALIGNTIANASLVPGQILNDHENQTIVDAQRARLAAQDARGVAQDARQAAADQRDQTKEQKAEQERQDRGAIMTAGLDTTGPTPQFKFEPAVAEAMKRGRTDLAKELIDAHDKATRDAAPKVPEMGTPAYEVYARTQNLLTPPARPSAAVLPPPSGPGAPASTGVASSGAPGAIGTPAPTAAPLTPTAAALQAYADQRTAAATAAAQAPAAVETARHNKEMERISALTERRTEATQKETARHNRVMEGAAAKAADPFGGQGGASGVDLAKLPPMVRDQAQALVDGRRQLDPRLASKPFGQTIINAAYALDPTFDQGNYNARYKARTDLTNPGGTGGKTIGALNTAIQHAGKLSDLIETLDNYDTPLANAIVNPLRTAAGSTKVTNFDTVAPQLAKEIERVWRGAGGTAGEIHDLIETIGHNKGKQQQREALQQFVELAKGKLDTLETQRDNVMGKKAGATIPILFDQNKPIIDTIAQRAAGATPSGPITVTAPDGSTHPFDTQAQADAFKKLAGIK